MRAKKAKTELRRTQIASAALSLVERHGLRGLNCARLAEAVGVVPSALYRHYPDKDRVIDAVLDLIQGRMAENVAMARTETGNALHRLRALLDRHVALVLKSSFIPRVVFSEEVLQRDSAHSQRMYQIVDQYLSGVEAIIREGQIEGAVRTDIDPKAARQLFLGVIQPSILLWTMSDGRFDLRAQTEACWLLFIQAIGTAAEARRQTNLASTRMTDAARKDQKT
jgi:AcrR family transcriptional regulator